MSPLPKKKKTPEELAALRKSLGISAEGPPPGAPGALERGPVAPAETPVEGPEPLPENKLERKEKERSQVQVEEAKADDAPRKDNEVVLEVEEPPVREPKPVRSLRKSAGLTVDKPKKAISKDSGKLPTRRHREGERIPLEKPTGPVSAGGGKLPTRKHNDRELAGLRHKPLPGVEDPAMHLLNRTAKLPVLLGIYGLGVLLMVLAMIGAISMGVPSFDLPFDWLRAVVALPNISMILFGIMAGGVAVMLLGAAWIFFKKPISQHHSAILTIIAMLVLVFGTLYFFPELHGA